MILSLDLETRSPADLKRSGAYRYFEHPWTEILCAAYAIDDGPVHGWTPGQPCPPEIVDLVNSGDGVSGWHVNFERQGWNRILGPKFGWPVPRLEQYQCTAAQAAAQSLPRNLEKAANVLRLPERKDMDGHKLMLRMAKPKRDGTWYEGDLLRLVDYCKGDVAVERGVRRKLRPLLEEEMLLWRFDQLINDRGITLDLDLVDDMLAVVTEYVDGLNAKLAELTGGTVEKATQTQRLKAWLKSQGMDVTSLAKTVIGSVLDQTMADACREALLTWQEGSVASVRKLQAAKACVGGDGRARGLLLFHGANTGRWSGQLLQPQNMVRGSGLVSDPDFAIEMIKLRSTSALEWCWDHPLTVVSDCLRGILTAGPGKDLMAGDFVNIEARITAWEANNTAKLAQFRRQDENPGDPHYEVYRLAAADIYHKGVEDISKEERQAGKVAELALGFGGGVDALHGMALNYHVDMGAAWPALWDAAGPQERDHVRARYREVVEKGNDKGLPQKAWEACSLIVRAWRRANKATVDMWDAFHSAAWHTLDEEGVDFPAGKVSFKREKGFLWLTLPSGRKLAYPTPAVENKEVPWSDKRLPLYDREHKDMLTVLAFEQGRALRYAFYPGITFQHSVQAVARDLLAYGMQNVERAGYPVIMSIHDEVIAEVVKGVGDLGLFLTHLCVLPAWAEGLPLTADGWRGFRYRKA